MRILLAQQYFTKIRPSLNEHLFISLTQLFLYKLLRASRKGRERGTSLRYQ